MFFVKTRLKCMGMLSFSQNRDGCEVFFFLFFWGGGGCGDGKSFIQIGKTAKTSLRELVGRPQLPISYPSQSQEDIRMFKYFDLISPKIGNWKLRSTVSCR